MPSRYSRHYYDLYRLAGSPVKREALSNLKLLEDVVAFKQRFYFSAWSRYDLARPGSFSLLPDQQHLIELKKDYSQMASMLFGQPPSFDDIVNTLRTLEDEINTQKRESLPKTTA